MSADDGHGINNNTLAIGVVVGILGILVLYYLQSSGRNGKQGKKASKVDSLSIPTASSMSGEHKSDFLRNLHSLQVCIKNGIISNMIESIFNQVQPTTVEEISSGLNSFLRSNGVNQDIAVKIVQLLTVTPSMMCLMNANIMPPAMFQPRYCLLISNDGSVRCTTQGYVGGPVMGPADPNKKYTNTCMRLLSEDLCGNTKKHGEITIEYSVQRCKDGWLPSDDAEILSQLASSSDLDPEKWIQYFNA